MYSIRKTPARYPTTHRPPAMPGLEIPVPEKIMLDLDAIEAAAISAKAVSPGNPWFYQEKSDAYTHIVRVENPALNNSMIVVQMGQRTDGRPEALARHFAQSNPDVVLSLVAELKALRAGTTEANWQAGYNEGSRMGTNTALGERDGLRRDAKLYRFISQLAWYVDQAAFVYNIGNAKSPWAGERAPVDAEDVEAAVIAAMETTPNPA